jgi:lysozyme family protein
MSDFDVSNAFVMQFDGFKNDAAPGENFATSYGVTEYTWNDACSRGIVSGPIGAATMADCVRIGRIMFWNVNNLSAVPSGCNLVIYNNGFGCGVGHAAKLAQRVVGVDQDGVIGPKTIAAIVAFGVKSFIDAMVAADEAYFAALANAPLYLRGWDRREEAARNAAYALAGIGQDSVPKTAPTPSAATIAPISAQPSADQLDAQFNPGS